MNQQEEVKLQALSGFAPFLEQPPEQASDRNET
jgi:hypothetical protein